MESDQGTSIRFVNPLDVLGQLESYQDLSVCKRCENAEAAKRLMCYNQAWEESSGKVKTCSFI